MVDKNIYKLSIRGAQVNTELLVGGLPPFIRPISLGFDPLNNTIALGTISSGVYYLQKQQFKVRDVINNPELDNVFYSIVPLKNGWLYSGKGFTLNIFNNQQHNILPNIFSYVGLYKNNDTVYLSYRNKLMRFKSDEKPIPETVCDIDEIMLKMEEGPDGKTWICTSNKIGTLIQDSINWESGELADKITGSSFQVFSFINKSQMLIGTYNNLYKYDIYSKKLLQQSTFDNKRVRNIVRDKKEGYWICTYGQGLYYMTKDRYYHLNEPSLTTPHTLLTDANNKVWISTNNGLFVADRDALVKDIKTGATPSTLFKYTKEYGFMTNEFNGGCNPCGLQLSDTMFLFPSMAGLVYFNPLSTTRPWPDYPILIESLLIDTTQITFKKNTVFPYNFQNAEFTISTPYYGDAAGLKLEYKIIGYDKNWIPINLNRQIVLKGLPHGNYQLSIRKPSEKTPGGFIINSIPFKVATPFWQTWWFNISAIILAILFLSLLFWLRLSAVKRHKKELKHEVALRTKELEHSMELLSAANEKLKSVTLFREQILSFVLHDIRTPLKFIDRISASLFKNYKKMDSDAIHHQIGELYDATIHFTSFSEDFLQWMNTHSNNFQLNVASFNLHEKIYNVFNLYSELAKQKKISLINDIPTYLSISTDKVMLGIVLRNITDNAIKYTDSGSIRISAKNIKDKIYISIADTGRGMTTQQLNDIYKNVAGLKKTTSGGLGMLIIKDMLALLGGNMHIESKPMAGTTISIILPALL